jgi:AraC-like DNA-binding protein
VEVHSINISDLPPSESSIGLYHIDKQLVNESVHRHGHHEVVAISRGRGKVRIGSFSGEFGPGTVAFISRGTDHFWSSRGEKSLVSADFLHLPRAVFSPSLLALPDAAGVRSLFSEGRLGAVCRFPEFDRVSSRLRTIKGARGFLRLARIYALIDLLVFSNAFQPIDNHKVSVHVFRDRLHLAMACDYIAEHFRGDLNRDRLASQVGMDASSFSRFFRRASGQKFTDYLNVIRIREAAKLLAARRRLPISSIAKLCGYSNLSVFNQQFRKRLGMTPRDYRRQLEFEPVSP